MLTPLGPGYVLEETSGGDVYRIDAESNAPRSFLWLRLVPGVALLIGLGWATITFVGHPRGYHREDWLGFFILHLGFSPLIVRSILPVLWIVAGVDEVVLERSRIGMRRRIGPFCVTKWRRRAQVRRITLVKDEARRHLGCRLRIEAEGSKPADSGWHHPCETLRLLARRLAERCGEKPPDFDGFFDVAPKVSLAEESDNPTSIRDRAEPPVGCEALLTRGLDGLRIDIPAPGVRHRETTPGLVVVAFIFGGCAAGTVGCAVGMMETVRMGLGWYEASPCIVFGGVLLLLSGGSLGGLIYLINLARRSVALTVSPDGLSIEHSWPDGRVRVERSWPRDSIRAVSAAVEVWKESDGPDTYHPRLRVATRNGRTTDWLEDRPKAELEWIATTLRQGLGRPVGLGPLDSTDRPPGSGAADTIGASRR